LRTQAAAGPPRGDARPDARDADQEPPSEVARPALAPQSDLRRAAEIEPAPAEDDRENEEALEDAVVDAREVEREAEPVKRHRDPRARNGRHREQAEDQPKQREGPHRRAI